MTKSYISNLSLSNWGGSKPSGSFSFIWENNSTNYTLDQEDCEKIFSVLHEIVGRKKEQMAEAMRNIELPTLLGYDRAKTIEGEQPPLLADEEIPF